MTGDPAASASGAGVDVEAGLIISVDGPRGRATATLSGAGRQVVLRTDRPEVLLDAAGLQAGVGLADVLRTAGLRAELHGPRGRLATLDPDRTSRTGALMGAGSHLYVDPRGWGTLARAAGHESVRVVRRIDTPALFTAAAAFTATVVALLARRRWHGASGRGC